MRITTTDIAKAAYYWVQGFRHWATDARIDKNGVTSVHLIFTTDMAPDELTSMDMSLQMGNGVVDPIAYERSLQQIRGMCDRALGILMGARK